MPTRRVRNRTRKRARDEALEEERARVELEEQRAREELEEKRAREELEKKRAREEREEKRARKELAKKRAREEREEKRAQKELEEKRALKELEEERAQEEREERARKEHEDAPSSEEGDAEEGNPDAEDGSSSSDDETLQTLSLLKGKSAGRSPKSMSEQRTSMSPNPLFVASAIGERGKVENPFGTCSHCGKEFSSRNGLEYHMERKVCQHADKPFSCPLCKRTFSTEARLTYHLDNKICHRKTPMPIRTKRDSRSKNRGRQGVKAKKDNSLSTPNKTEVPVQRRSSRTRTPIKSSPGSTNDEDNLESNDDSTVDKKTIEEGGKKGGKRLGGRNSRLNDNSFQKLKAGAKFLTQFGIVEVIADDRLPKVHHVSSIDIPAASNQTRKIDRFNRRKVLVTDLIASGTRYRREELKKLYLDYKSKGASESMSQEKVWDLYCQNLKPEQILTDGLSWAYNDRILQNKKVKIVSGDDDDDPRFPKDYYPDRIVTCKVVNDKREVVIGNLCGDHLPDGDESVDNRVDLRYREKSEFRKQTVPMRIFIARKELTREYNCSKILYMCGNCGKHYPGALTGMRYHMSSRTCTRKKDDKKKERDEHIKRIEGSALSGYGSRKSLLITTHGIIKVPEKMKNGPAYFGNPWRIKEHKKHRMPPWLTFNPDHSTIYPEIYKNLGFRRGSQNRNHFNKKKREDGYVPSSEKSRVRKKLRKFRIREAREKEERLNREREERLNREKEVLAMLAPALPSADVSTETKKLPEQMMKEPSTKESQGTEALNQPDLTTRAPATKAKTPKPAKKPVEKKKSPKQGKKSPAAKRAETLEASDHLDLPTTTPDVKEKASKRAKADVSTEKQKQKKQAKKKKPAAKKDKGSTSLDVSDLPINASADIANPPKQAKKTSKKPAATKNKRKRESRESNLQILPDDLPPLPAIAQDPMDSDVDFGQNENERDYDPILDSPPYSNLHGGRSNDWMDENEDNDSSDESMTSPRPPDEHGVRRKRVMISNKKDAVVIDTQVLAEECESGRYPSINRYYGNHDKQCTLCKKPNSEPLVNCDFCKNSVHQYCIDKRMLQKDPQVVIRENEPHDMMMCHDCIVICLFRRSRAENRRVVKWQHELSKAGLENAPEAANLTVEVNIRESDNARYYDEPREEPQPTYKPCPDGGPGGLVCCSYCTAAYSRILSNTAKEMEAQSVARAGQEVSEMMELLGDAKQRLQRASEVSHLNEERRSLLDKNQGAMSPSHDK